MLLKILLILSSCIQSEFDKIWPMLRVLTNGSSPKDKYTLVSGLMQTNLVPHGPHSGRGGVRPWSKV